MFYRNKDICKMDCEAKKVFESRKYDSYRTTTAIFCLQCVHHIKKDHFIQRVIEEEVKPISQWKKFKTRVGFN